MSGRLCAYWQWERAEAEHGLGGTNPLHECGDCPGCDEAEDERHDANAALELHEHDHRAGLV